jgi:hypothetical protein
VSVLDRPIFINSLAATILAARVQNFQNWVGFTKRVYILFFIKSTQAEEAGHCWPSTAIAIVAF